MTGKLTQAKFMNSWLQMLTMERYLKMCATLKQAQFMLEQKLLMTIDITNVIILYKYADTCFSHYMGLLLTSTHTNIGNKPVPKQ
jgi:hypothetical protein